MNRKLDAELFNDYQSCLKLGISGTRNSEERLKNYRLSPYLKPHFKVLDVGCNTGILSLLIAQKVSQVVGIEVHKEFIEQANEYKRELGIENCTFINSAFEDVKFKQSSYDVVLSLASHYWMRSLEEYIKTLKSTISPGGFLLVESHNLKNSEHVLDWQTISEAFADARIVEQNQTKEQLVYKRGSGVHEREFRLYQL